MSTCQSKSESFAPGQRVIYTRMQRPKNTLWHATYLRETETARGLMYVIALDVRPKQPCTVGRNSIRAA